MLTIILGACEDCQLGKHCSAYLIYENIGYRTWNLFAYYNSCLIDWWLYKVVLLL